MHRDQFFLQFGKLLWVRGGEIFLFLPVLFDVIELEPVKGGAAQDFPFAVAQCDVNVVSRQVIAPIQRYGPLDRFFRENGTDVYPVYGAIGRQGNPCDGQHGGESVGSYDRSPVDGGCRHLTWPTDDAGHTNTALVRGTLALAKSTGGTASRPLLPFPSGPLSEVKITKVSSVSPARPRLS